jgi:hypothetical protein
MLAGMGFFEWFDHRRLAEQRHPLEADDLVARELRP